MSVHQWISLHRLADSVRRPGGDTGPVYPW
jgi:hypothetical protein